MRYAIIDIGSNTVKISFYDNESGTIRHILSQSNPLGLAMHCRDNRLSEEGLAALISTLKEYRHLATVVSADCISCIATASLRNLINSRDVVEKIKQTCDLTIDVISGEREAELGFMGLLATVGKPNDGIFLDLGGASTEMIVIQNGNPIAKTSLPFGALKLYHRFVKGILPNDDERIAIRNFVISELSADPIRVKTPYHAAYLTGGTAKAMAKLMRLSVSNGDTRLIFSGSDFRSLLLRFLEDDGEFIHYAAARIPERIHMIVPGLWLLSRYSIAFTRIRCILYIAGYGMVI